MTITVVTNGDFKVKTIEVKPCPFCGGEAEIGGGELASHIACTKYGAFSGTYSFKWTAIKAWNKRSKKTSEGLKPCPCCGGKAEIRGDDDMTQAICTKCEMHSPLGKKEEVIKAWNSREKH